MFELEAVDRFKSFTLVANYKITGFSLPLSLEAMGILKCNRSVRIIDMLEALQFMSINERIEYNICLLIYKMINGSCPYYLRDKVNLVRRSINCDKVYIDKCGTRTIENAVNITGLRCIMTYYAK